MDPIHPILPQPLNIPPVQESPRVGRIDRKDPRQEGAGRRDRQDRKRGSAGDELDGSDPGGDGEPGSHIDITA